MSDLRQHIHDLHPQIKRLARSNADLSRQHADCHHRLGSFSHRHDGTNTGPDDRPPGWFTGQDVVLIDQKGRELR